MTRQPDLDTDIQLHSNIKKIVGWLIGTAGLISAIPVTVQVFNIFDMTILEQIMSVVVLLLSVWTLFSVLTIRDLRDETRRISDEAERAISKIKDKATDVYYGLAFANFYEEPPDEFDDTHYITETTSEIEMTEDGWIFREVFSGFNASDQESKCLSVRIDGDAPLDVEDTEFAMYYRDDGKWVESTNWEAKNVGKYSLRFLLYFEEPLAPDESFDIKYESATGAWPTQSEEYVEIPQHRFIRGTERLRAKFELDNQPEDVTAKKVTHNMSTSYFRSAERIEFEVEDRDIDVFKDGTTYLSQIEDTQADALYIFGFEF